MVDALGFAPPGIGRIEVAQRCIPKGEDGLADLRPYLKEAAPGEGLALADL